MMEPARQRAAVTMGNTRKAAAAVKTRIVTTARKATRAAKTVKNTDITANITMAKAAAAVNARSRNLVLV